MNKRKTFRSTAPRRLELEVVGLEEGVVHLLRHGVAVLADVRRDPDDLRRISLGGQDLLQEALAVVLGVADLIRIQSLLHGIGLATLDTLLNLLLDGDHRGEGHQVARVHLRSSGDQEELPEGDRTSELLLHEPEQGHLLVSDRDLRPEIFEGPRHHHREALRRELTAETQVGHLPGPVEAAGELLRVQRQPGPLRAEDPKVPREDVLVVEDDHRIPRGRDGPDDPIEGLHDSRLTDPRSAGEENDFPSHGGFLLKKGDKTIYRHTLYHKNPFYSCRIDSEKELWFAGEREPAPYDTGGM